jgi:FMN phosphatase YigB (HAD superfamily)
MYALADLALPAWIEPTLQQLKQAGYALWIITKGDLIRQAIKLSCFPFLNAFEVVEIVERKDAALYRRVLADNSCSPAGFTMVGDCFREDIVPVVRLGDRAIHVPERRWALLRSLESLLPTRRIRICRNVAEVPDAIAAMG